MSNTYSKSSLSDLIFNFRKNILKSIKREGFEHDLTFSQVELLGFIGPTGKETMKSIADHLGITPPSATEIVKEMEKKGLIKRIDDKKDRRIVFIVLSTSSKKLSVSLCKQKELMFKKMLSKLNKKDYENFERIIRILITN
ncbi:MAG: MarR family transcriptional regulator [Candidatus Pacebacteria bacterium]|nr:MarR family transcriptional regulator [Candidatus Paceibacterota bacterium]